MCFKSKTRQVKSIRAFSKSSPVINSSVDSYNLSDIHSKYATPPNPDLYKNRLLLQSEFENLSSRNAEQQLLGMYEHGETPCRLPANQLQQAASKNTRTELNIAPGVTSCNPEDIYNKFKLCYSSLYTSESLQDTSYMQAFLDKVDIPNLSSEQQTAQTAQTSWKISQQISQQILQCKVERPRAPIGSPLSYGEWCFATIPDAGFNLSFT